MKTNMSKRRFSLTSLTGVQAIRQGLVSIIPILLIGAFALVLRSLPISPYQELIQHRWDGLLNQFFSSIYNVTFGLLSLYITCAIGYHYAVIKSRSDTGTRLGSLIVSAACFIILTGFDNLNIDTLGPKGMFLAIVSTLGASFLFFTLQSRSKPLDLSTDGADVHFSSSLRLLLPICITLLIFAVINQTLFTCLNGQNAHDLFLNAANHLFELTAGGPFTGFLFVFVSSLLWFFGIHGGDVLEGVSSSIFAPATDVNIALAAAGQQPTEVLTKPFFDVFVLMGGCGSTMCLLFALLLFSRRRSNRRLARLAAIPMIFNINEIMVFGLPIIYNPTLLIPFLCTPLLCYFTTYAAMAIGLVPLVTASVEWTTPILIGGYLATGTVAGALLQFFNLCLGVIIYRPFVRKYDKELTNAALENYESLVTAMKESEASRTPVHLMQLPGSKGTFAKALSSELQHAMAADELHLFYQPQYRLDGGCLGAEALLRWNHSLLGTVYPPLIMQLAQEGGYLEELERWVITRGIDDANTICGKTALPLKISLNVTGTSMQQSSFEDFLVQEIRHVHNGTQICLELTEQATLQFNDQIQTRLSRLHAIGYRLAIDDFSMGNTSLQYLQGNYFDLVKLDGSLVQQSLSNQRSLEIVSSIVALAGNLGFDVLAEYVSTEELRDNMAKVGCTQYQGWLYAPALPLPELLERLQSEVSA